MRRFPLSLILVTSAFALWFYYLGTRLVRPLVLAWPLKAAAWVLLSIPFAAVLWLPLVYWRRRRRARATGETGAQALPLMVHVSYLSLGFLSIALSSAILFDLFRLVARVSGHPASLSGDSASLSVLALSLGGLGLGVFEGNRLPRLKQVDVPIEGLPPEWEGFRIVQLSDLHVGHSIRKPFVEKVVNAVNTLAPDIVALTGDMVDGNPEHLREDLSPLTRLTPTEGVFYVTGNHEYYWGAALWIEEMRRLGVIPLINTYRVLERGGTRLCVAGVSDWTSGLYPGGTPSDPKAAIAGAPESSVRLLLAHQPKTAPAAAEAGYDLQISGHTHGGQFIPWTFFIRFFHPFWKGLNRCKRMWIYVNLGTGFWGPPVRLGAPSEITLLRLVRRAA